MDLGHEDRIFSIKILGKLGQLGNKKRGALRCLSFHFCDDRALKHLIL